MVKGKCPICNMIVIEDLEEYKEKYPDEKEVQCPYCQYMMRII
jgi:quinolinate synthase